MPERTDYNAELLHEKPFTGDDMAGSPPIDALPRRDRLTHVRRFTPIVALVTSLAIVTGCGQQASAPASSDAPQEVDYDVASYGIGVRIATSLEDQYGQAIDPDSLSAGIRDALSGEELAFDGAAMAGAIDQLVADAQAAVNAAEQEKVAEGMSFLADNGTREGVVTTASGLQYEVLESGDGDTPGPTDKVSTHYHGTLLDGTVFDSSVQRGMPIEFPVNGVIKGWTEALQLMQVGDKWKLFIPPELAYGERGAGGAIGPNETLIFEVQLLNVIKSD